MKLYHKWPAGIFLACLFVFSSSALAMNKQQEKEFNRLMSLSMPQLTKEAAELLEKKYPDEDWGKFNFPQFVYTNESTEAAYKIAVKEPRLLSKITCYCFCEQVGHKNLLYCFIKEGKKAGEFEPHASE